MAKSPEGSVTAGTDGPPATARGLPPTFLFTDVVGSTRLWERNPEAMRSALERHDVIVRSAVAGSDGTVVKATGDGIMAVFDTPTGAVGGSLRDQGPDGHPHG